MEAMCMFCFCSLLCREAYYLAYRWITVGEASVRAAVMMISHARKGHCCVRVQEKHHFFLSHMTSYMDAMMNLYRNFWVYILFSELHYSFDGRFVVSSIVRAQHDLAFPTRLDSSFISVWILLFSMRIRDVFSLYL